MSAATSTAVRSRLTSVALWLAVVATIVFLPGGMSRWFLPKAALLAVAIVVASLGAAGGRLPRWFLVVVGGASAVLVVAALLSSAPAAELWGRWPRYEGAVMLPVYFGAVWLGARTLGPHARPAQIRILHGAVAAASLALGIVSALEAFGLRPIPSNETRPGALLGNATDQGLLGAVFLAVLVMPAVRSLWPVAPTPAVVVRGKKKRAAQRVLPEPVGPVARLLLLAGVVFAILTVALSASRGAIGSAVIALVIVWAAELVRLRRSEGAGSAAAIRRTVTVGLSTLVVLAATVFALPYTRDRVLGTGGLAAETISGRFLIWKEAWQVVLQRPIFGWGPSGFVDAVAQVHDAQWQQTVGSAATLDSPHDWILQVVVAGGFVLLAVVLVVIVWTVLAGWRNWQAASGPAAHDPARADLLAAAAATLGAMGFGWATGFTSPGTVILPALLLGALVARAPAGRSVFSARPFAVLRTVGLIGWAVFLGVAASAEIPLNAAVTAASRGDVDEAQGDFSAAQGMRPWDSDIALIAAQSFAAAADEQVPGAAAATVTWATRSLAGTPNALLAAKALAVGEQYSGDLAAADHTLARLSTTYPEDSEVAHRYGGVLLLEGDAAAAEQQLLRASRLSPGDASVWQTLEYLYRQTGNDAAAVNAAQMAAKLPD